MKQMMAGDHRDPYTYAILGAAMEVHRILGPHFAEPVYQCAFAAELLLRSIPHIREVSLPVTYKGRKLEVSYRADFLCYDRILVELKSVQRLTSREESQIINYLAASGMRLGLLLNFGSRSLQYQRFLAPRRIQSVSSA